jgi:hypothetical protein
LFFGLSLLFFLFFDKWREERDQKTKTGEGGRIVSTFAKSFTERYILGTLEEHIGNTLGTHRAAGWSQHSQSRLYSDIILQIYHVRPITNSGPIGRTIDERGERRGQDGEGGRGGEGRMGGETKGGGGRGGGGGGGGRGGKGVGHHLSDGMPIIRNAQPGRGGQEGGGGRGGGGRMGGEQKGGGGWGGGGGGGGGGDKGGGHHVLKEWEHKLRSLIDEYIASINQQTQAQEKMYIHSLDASINIILPARIVQYRDFTVKLWEKEPGFHAKSFGTMWL